MLTMLFGKIFSGKAYPKMCIFVSHNALFGNKFSGKVYPKMCIFVSHNALFGNEFSGKVYPKLCSKHNSFQIAMIVIKAV